LLIGFSTGLWDSAGRAAIKSTEMAEQAVVKRLTPICFAQFKMDAKRDQKLIELKGTNSWRRATMPFEMEFDAGVA